MPEDQKPPSTPPAVPAPRDFVAEARAAFNRCLFSLGVATYELEIVSQRKADAMKQAVSAAEKTNEMIAAANAELANKVREGATKPALSIVPPQEKGSDTKEPG